MNSDILINAIKNYDKKVYEFNKKYNFNFIKKIYKNSDIEYNIIKIQKKNSKDMVSYKFYEIGKLFNENNKNLFIWSWSDPLSIKNHIIYSRKLLLYGLDLSITDNNNNPLLLFIKTILINGKVIINYLFLFRVIIFYLTKAEFIFFDNNKLIVLFKFKD